jgi:hypothetical protein
MHGFLKGAAGAFFCLCVVPGCQEVSPALQKRGGWGVDACLTAHVGPPARAAYLPQLRAAGVTILRERGPNPAMGELKAAGFHVVSFLGLPPVPVEQGGDALPEDLLAVFAAAKAMQQSHGPYVDTWEMVCEPDVGYCRDLPDRVAAFQKAVYLGIKSESESEGESERGKAEGAARAPLVLMGALALPPGPWLERAARNGLLDYTDAYNFHFYGFADDLAGVIRAHEAFAAKWVDLRTRTIVGSDLVSGPDDSGRSARKARPYDSNGGPSFASEALSVSKFQLSDFPVWITECGLNAVVPDDFLNSERRGLQAVFTLATAQQAQAADNVAVFMPFILVHAEDPHALTLSAERPLPAWTAYADYTRQHPFPSRVLAMPPRHPNPIVLQWMPDNRTAIPHKVSGCYRFWQDQPMRGHLRIYNFSKKPVKGTLEADALGHVALACPDLQAIASETGGHPGKPEVNLPNVGRASGMGDLLMSGGLKQTHGQDARATNNIQPAFRSSVLTIPTLGRLELPVTFTPTATGYFRDFWGASFLDFHGRRSPVYFGLEAMPDEDDLDSVPIELSPPSSGRIDHEDLDGTTVTSQSGAWTGINGAFVQAQGPGERCNNQDSRSKTDIARPRAHLPIVGDSERSAAIPGCIGCRLEACATKPDRSFIAESAGLLPALPSIGRCTPRPLTLKVSVTQLNRDPLFPAMAIARVNGLPPRGFLRLQLDRPMDSAFGVRVDLVDHQGQRFTVWENLGASYFGPSDDVWLNLEDFHIYFWGRCSAHPVFRPQDVEEIRLRLYFTRANDQRSVRLSYWQAREDPD